MILHLYHIFLFLKNQVSKRNRRYDLIFVADFPCILFLIKLNRAGVYCELILQSSTIIVALLLLRLFLEVVAIL